MSKIEAAGRRAMEAMYAARAANESAKRAQQEGQPAPDGAEATRPHDPTPSGAVAERTQAATAKFAAFRARQAEAAPVADAPSEPVGSLTEEAAREKFNAWYDRQAMPQLLARPWVLSPTVLHSSAGPALDDALRTGEGWYQMVVHPDDGKVRTQAAPTFDALRGAISGQLRGLVMFRETRIEVENALWRCVDEAEATLASEPAQAGEEPWKALERVTDNFRRLLAGKPVRDVDETLAECDRAIAARSAPGEKP